MLGLSENNLSGSIPPELGNLASLDVLDFTSNSLSGTIPATVCNLSYLDSSGDRQSTTILYSSNPELTGCSP